MHAAQVLEWGQVPTYVDLEAPCVPDVDSGLVQLRVKAVGLHQTVRSRAAGRHYTSGGLPYVPGVDGVGTDPDGNQVYFSTHRGGEGSLSEILNVPTRAVWPLPKEADASQVAGLVNPGLSSWMALRSRTANLPENFTILIMGVTSASGKLAVEMSRSQGAGKMIGLARNEEALAKLGLDQTIVLRHPPEETDLSTLGDVDVILDYVYGPPTLHVLQSLKSRRPVQYVHIGTLAGQPDISLPGSLLRSKDLTIRGSGMGSFNAGEVERELPDLLKFIVGLEPKSIRVVSLKYVEKAWNQPGERKVFVL